MNLFNSGTIAFSPAIVVLNIVFSLALQLVIVWVYKRTHRGLSYSQGFIFTLVIVGILGTMVMMIVQNNLVGAFALLGAFSLIRFRTILKETRDVAFVFFSLAMGVAVGTGAYSIAVIGIVILSVIILVMNKLNVGNIDSGLGFLLTVTSREGINMETLKSIFLRYTTSCDLLQARSYEDGTRENIFSVALKDDLQSGNMIDEIKKTQHIVNIELITSKHSLEY